MNAQASGTRRHLLSVVVASACVAERAALIQRACNSVRAMAGGLDYSIIVVANGPRVSEAVLEDLSSRPDVRLIRVRSGSHPLARRIGAEFAESEFLAFLDDDDELIADTLGRKIDYFRSHPDVDVLITDGFRVSGSIAERIFPPPEVRCTDLIESMMGAGWGAGALTLRTQAVDLAVLDAEFRHLEWTLTAFQLARRYKLGFLDEPTYRYYEDTPNSLSKLFEHRLAAPELWRRLSESYAGTPHELKVRQRYGHECHNVAHELLLRRRLGSAWMFHLRSLAAPGGLAKLPFTARLLLASLVNPFRKADAFHGGGHLARPLDAMVDREERSNGSPVN